jgi:hypothetical protein
LRRNKASGQSRCGRLDFFIASPKSGSYIFGNDFGRWL